MTGCASGGARNRPLRLSSPVRFRKAEARPADRHRCGARADATSSGSPRGVWRAPGGPRAGAPIVSCSALTILAVVLPHLRMLPAILRMIVPAVSDASRGGGTHGRDAPVQAGRDLVSNTVMPAKLYSGGASFISRVASRM